MTSAPDIPSISGVAGGRFPTLTHTQHDAYMFTLSMQTPSLLSPTLLALNPSASNSFKYHGFNAEDLSSTRPPTASARFSLDICLDAALSLGSNQSMLSITTATVSVPGAILAITSSSSSVWIRSPSSAPSRESAACACGLR